jgi:hypothetical protein
MTRHSGVIKSLRIGNLPGQDIHIVPCPPETRCNQGFLKKAGLARRYVPIETAKCVTDSIKNKLYEGEKSKGSGIYA